MKINWDEAPLVGGGEFGVTRRFVFGQRMSCLQMAVTTPGPLDIKPHWHENEQWVVCTAGRIVFVCEDLELDLEAGDVAYIPAGKFHTATRAGEEGGVCLELSAPPRLDLVPGSIVPSALRFD
ncbi:cupin domain-containing protein [Micromonospora lupini]|uniref:cupin domain-containing protein n=1 Tax=Micromonospora lupini TaxID=285679 RepID=UPI0033E20939